jgi:hypothetical protein
MSGLKFITDLGYEYAFGNVTKITRKTEEPIPIIGNNTETSNFGRISSFQYQMKKTWTT